MSTTVPSSVSQQDINLTLWTTPDRIANFDWALQSAAAILPHYETLFNYAYFLPKLDILALPNFLFQAMENWVCPFWQFLSSELGGHLWNPCVVVSLAVFRK